MKVWVAQYPVSFHSPEKNATKFRLIDAVIRGSLSCNSPTGLDCGGVYSPLLYVPPECGSLGEEETW